MITGAASSASNTRSGWTAADAGFAASRFGALPGGMFDGF